MCMKGMTQFCSGTITMYNHTSRCFAYLKKFLCHINRILIRTMTQFHVFTMSIRLSTLYQFLLSLLIFQHSFLTPFLEHWIGIGITTTAMIIISISSITTANAIILFNFLFDQLFLNLCHFGYDIRELLLLLLLRWTHCIYCCRTCIYIYIYIYIY